MKETRIFKQKALLRPLLALVLTLGLTACSDGGGGSRDSAVATVEILNTGDTAEVFEGDELEKITDEARIEVRHEEVSNRKYVTVLSGTAELVRGDYYENR
ncbi:hypothetical protein [Marinobacter sp. OP 3.4]|uniref:hypothetical protein n=1 Tax=Marinobacter sp. OP 3.4 TaxID=3076501 RepID=UPI002E237C74